jgi:hypothetical protein
VTTIPFARPLPPADTYWHGVCWHIPPEEADEVLGQLAVLLIVPLVQDQVDQVKTRQQGGGQVDVLSQRHVWDVPERTSRKRRATETSRAPELGQQAHTTACRRVDTLSNTKQ